MEIQSHNDYSQDYSTNMDILLIKFMKKEENKMPRYEIVEDNGDLIKYRKIEDAETSRSTIASYEARMQEIAKHITEENEEYAKLQELVDELKSISKIANEKRQKELEDLSETSNEQI